MRNLDGLPKKNGASRCRGCCHSASGSPIFRDERRRQASFLDRRSARETIFRRITEEPVGAGEIFWTERLQRMLGDHGAGVIEQLAHEHARRDGTVVADRAADIAEVENVARGEERFEKEIAIVIARRAIAGTGVLRDQIEGRRAIVARVGGVVHSDQTNDPERHRPHRLERAKCDAADEKTGAALDLPRAPARDAREHIERHRFVETGKRGGFA